MVIGGGRKKKSMFTQAVEYEEVLKSACATGKGRSFATTRMQAHRRVRTRSAVVLSSHGGGVREGHRGVEQAIDGRPGVGG